MWHYMSFWGVHEKSNWSNVHLLKLANRLK